MFDNLIYLARNQWLGVWHSYLLANSISQHYALSGDKWRLLPTVELQYLSETILID